MTSHRKAPKPLSTSGAASYQQMDDEDEDKYRRKGLLQLFAALGLVYAPSLYCFCAFSILFRGVFFAFSCFSFRLFLFVFSLLFACLLLSLCMCILCVFFSVEWTVSSRIIK